MYQLFGFIGAAALFVAPVVAQAQSAPAAIAPVDQAEPAVTAPAEPELATTPAAAPVTASAADGVTREGSKYMKDGRKATKVEVAEFKKAQKAKPE